jgi:hypothetical protein
MYLNLKLCKCGGGSGRGLAPTHGHILVYVTIHVFVKYRGMVPWFIVYMTMIVKNAQVITKCTASVYGIYTCDHTRSARGSG